MSFLTLTLLGAAEAAMIIFTGLRLMGAGVPLRLLVIMGLACSLGIRVIRYFLYVIVGAPFGVHVVVAVFMYFGVIRRYFRVSEFVAAGAVLVSFLILIIGTGLVLMVYANGGPAFQAPAVLLAVENLPLATATVIIWKRGLCLIPPGLRSE
ncbi:MAG: hypothetical protein AB1445_12380 [Bacillota bacterium]